MSRLPPLPADPKSSDLLGFAAAQRCRPGKRRREPQRGNTLVLALIVMSALATLGSLTVVSVQSSLKTSTNDRAQAIATYAAESGAAVAMDFLRNNFDLNVGWSAFVSQANNAPFVMTAAQAPSIGAPPGNANNLFTNDQNAWFEVLLLNNRDDLWFNNAPPNDNDGRIVIRATGHGPQGSLAIIEWDVQRVGFPPPPPLPPPPAPPPWTPLTILPYSIPQGFVLVSWRVVSL